MLLQMPPLLVPIPYLMFTLFPLVSANLFKCPNIAFGASNTSFGISHTLLVHQYFLWCRRYLIWSQQSSLGAPKSSFGTSNTYTFSKFSTHASNLDDVNWDLTNNEVCMHLNDINFFLHRTLIMGRVQWAWDTWPEHHCDSAWSPLVYRGCCVSSGT